MERYFCLICLFISCSLNADNLDFLVPMDVPFGIRMVVHGEEYVHGAEDAKSYRSADWKCQMTANCSMSGITSMRLEFEPIRLAVTGSRGEAYISNIATAKYDGKLWSWYISRNWKDGDPVSDVRHAEVMSEKPVYLGDYNDHYIYGLSALLPFMKFYRNYGIYDVDSAGISGVLNLSFDVDEEGRHLLEMTSICNNINLIIGDIGGYHYIKKVVSTNNLCTDGEDFSESYEFDDPAIYKALPFAIPRRFTREFYTAGKLQRRSNVVLQDVEITEPLSDTFFDVYDYEGAVIYDSVHNLIYDPHAPPAHQVRPLLREADSSGVQ